MNQARVLTAVALVITSCAHFGSVKERRQVESFEGAQPDSAALHAGTLTSTLKMLQNMDEWRGFIQTKGLPKQDSAELDRRLVAAKTDYLLRAAKEAERSTPDLAFWLTTQALPSSQAYEPTNSQVVEAARDYSKKRALPRQQLLSQYSTYAYKGEPGSCVFSPEPFGKEGTPNPGLTFCVNGASPSISVRCYLKQLIGPAHVPVPLDPTGTFVARVTTGPLAERTALRVAGYGELPKGQKYVDFKMQNSTRWPLFSPSNDFAHIEVELQFVWVKDQKIVFVDGALRPRPDWQTVTLATSSFFWERDPARLTAMSTSR